MKPKLIYTFLILSFASACFGGGIVYTKIDSSNLQKVETATIPKAQLLNDKANYLAQIVYLDAVLLEHQKDHDAKVLAAQAKITEIDALIAQMN